MFLGGVRGTERSQRLRSKVRAGITNIKEQHPKCVRDFRSEGHREEKSSRRVLGLSKSLSFPFKAKQMSLWNLKL